MSLMSSFYVGVSGLNTSSNSLNTTAHNLANVETTGYVRQQVVQVDRTYLNWGVNHISTFQTGLGVDISAVRQVRDVFLDKSYRLEVGRQGFYEVQYEAVQEVESMFGELEGVTFQDELEDLWTSLQEMAKDPSDVTRTSVIQSSVNFINRANIISEQLKEYQVNLNTQITSKVNRINKIADDIVTLNKDIKFYESNGLEHANDLRDERNNLLDELGQIIHITYKENSDGVVSVNAENVQLVSEDRAFKMGTVKVSETSDMLKPIWTSHSDMDVFNFDHAPSTNNDTDIGSLKGLLLARGSDAINYTKNFQRKDFASQDAYDAAIAQYNDETAPSVIMSVQTQLDTLIHGIVTTINDILSPNKDVTLTDGTKIKIFDRENAPAGMDSEKTMGQALFNRKYTDRYREATADELSKLGFTPAPGETILVYNQEIDTDETSLFTLGQIEINKDILANHSKLPLSSNTGSEDYDIDTINKIIAEWQKPFATINPNTLTKNNVNDYYTAFIGEIANRGEQYTAMSTNQAAMVNGINNQRQETSGVSSDEELTNLIKFQHAYNASARYISVVSEMLEHIVTRL